MDNTRQRITLHLSRESTEALYGVLCDLGEHWSAGVPVPYPESDAWSRMEEVMKAVEASLGKISFEEAMRRGLEERGILQADEGQNDR